MRHVTMPYINIHTTKTYQYFVVYKDDEPARKLLVAVLRQAINDLYLSTKSSDNSLCWFLSDSYEVMSFNWICDMLQIDKISIIKKHSHRIRKLLNGA